MRRVSAYIDGFNLYHYVDALGEPHLKWVNLRKLCETFIRPATEALGPVVFFTAIPYWKGADKVRRHKAFLAACRENSIRCELGVFKKQRERCGECGQFYSRRQEKQSDVRLATQVLDDAYSGAFDSYILITRDSDHVPLVELVAARFPSKELLLVAPPNMNHLEELQKHAKSKFSITRADLERCVLPEMVGRPGRTGVKRPAEYDPPAVPDPSEGRHA